MPSTDYRFIVVVPTYNNPATIKEVVGDIRHHGFEVIVVDDGSDSVVEDLFEEDETKGVYFERHVENLGKGEAIITGCALAKKMGFSHIVSMDGDGQHLASQIKLLIEACSGDEIIIGARNFDLEHVPGGSKFGRWFSNFWATWDTGYVIEDSLSGFRLYPVSILELPIKTSRYDWEMEVIVRHAWSKKAIKEVMVECYYPSPQQRVSHFKKFGDTMAIVWVHVQMLPVKWTRMLLSLFWRRK
jgi:glycosyltransferase involved in cell wall biosynthesis